MRYLYPIIFVHGIKGAWLKNQYPVDYQDEIYWSGIMLKKFGKLHLSDIDSSVDSDIDRFIFPHQAVPLAYESVVDEIREEVTPLTYVFTYDWRKDNRLSAEKLGEFVELVLKKAKVHAVKAGNPEPERVVLIGHSMGGLVIKWYVENVLKDKALDRVEKIISIATPYRGSLKAVEGILPGARNFFGLEAQMAMRKAARTLPGIYQLLPSWKDAVVNKKTGKPVDIFLKQSWQVNMVKKLEDTYGSAFFQNMLTDAKEFTQKMKKSYEPKIRKRFVCIYGTGSKTMRQVTVNTLNHNRFDFKNIKADKDGDGTVHKLSSMVPAGARSIDRHKKIVDLVGGQHVRMLNHENVQDYIIKLLKGSAQIETFESIL